MEEKMASEALVPQFKLERLLNQGMIPCNGAV